jgi:hypothetical protein
MMKQVCIIAFSLLPFQVSLMERNYSETSAMPNTGLFIQNQDRQTNEDQFVPDTSVNNLRLLHKTELFSNTQFFLDSLNFRNGPDWFLLLVNNQNQVCKLLFYPGSYAGEFSYFEVYQGSSSGFEELIIKRIESDQFVTESGICLGLSKEELFEIKGKHYSKELSTENEIIYSFDPDSELHDFLKQNNSAGYIAKYKFADNKLVEFGFGHIYP